MQLPEPDPTLMRMATELEAALIVAATTGASVDPAVKLATNMVDRQPLTGPPGRVLAMSLIELSLQHRAAGSPEPDPYSDLSRHLVLLGECTQADLDIAYMGRVLSTGLDQGWLSAGTYDRLVAFGGDDETFRHAMSRIKRQPPHEGRPSSA